MMMMMKVEVERRLTSNGPGPKEEVHSSFHSCNPSSLDYKF